MQPLKRILNPSYWLIAYLAARLSDEHNVFTISKSFDPVARVQQYRGGPIDVVVSIGAAYSPATCAVQINKGFAQAERAFEIGHITCGVFEHYKPRHINLCVDVRPWFDRLTEVFGTEPDAYITEQEMGWQQAGYLINNSVWTKGRYAKRDIFFFSGGAKSRQERFLQLTRTLPGRKIIHGGGWDDILTPADGYELAGFQQWFDSVQVFMEAKYGCVLHEPLGNERGWITAKYFEHLGARTIGFVDSLYDSGHLYIPADSMFRVGSAEEIADKIKTVGYDKLLTAQLKCVRQEWGDLEGFYVRPFLKKFREVMK